MILNRTVLFHDGLSLPLHLPSLFRVHFFFLLDDTWLEPRRLYEWKLVPRSLVERIAHLFHPTAVAVLVYIVTNWLRPTSHASALPAAGWLSLLSPFLVPGHSDSGRSTRLGDFQLSFPVCDIISFSLFFGVSRRMHVLKHLLITSMSARKTNRLICS